MGKPWTDKGLTKFTFGGLMEFLKFRGFTNVSRVQVQNFIKDLNDGRPCHGHQGLRREDGGTTTVRVWWVPAYKEEQVDMRVETNDEAARIPF